MKIYAKRLISVLLSLAIVFAICPFVYAQQKELPCEHSLSTTIAAKEPTCLDYGFTAQKECSKCSYVQLAQYIPETGHHYEMDESSLSASGEKYVCKDCGDYYVKNHANWTTYIIEKKPTCTQSGYTAERKCNDCGYSEESKYLPAVDHEFVAVVTDGTKHTVECKKCSLKVTDEKHETIFVYDGDNNCYSEEVTGKYICRICKTVMQSDVQLNEKEHHQNVTVEEKGEYDLHICNDCNFAKAEANDIDCSCGNKIDADTCIVKQPTCDKEGYIIYICDVCKKQKTVALEKFGHLLSKEFVTTRHATCQQTGIRSKDCLRCDYSEIDETEKIDHLYIVLKDGIPVTCTEDGLTYFGYCVYCSDTKQQVVIPATGHTLIDYNGEQFCTTCYKYLVETDKGTVACKCLCHNHDGLSVTIFKLIMFFAKIFGFMQSCDCGAVHY